MGIFAKDNVILKNNHWETYGLEWFISCNVNDKLNLLGIWGSGNYIEDIYVYLQIYKEKLRNLNNTLICGDFNSNSCWDKKHKRRNHSEVVKQLEDVNLYSCYHYKKKEMQGHESEPTFYMYRNKDKTYHIDYCFYDKENIKNLQVGKFKDWIHLSDHIPIVLDIKE
ncbi:endonuclease/exonuclease/phosphatase family protein [Clostridium massiliodielmoense]|uniref:endonuclease/exonuclease/phosphatase family protein n=1 Tax=Clostridium massiliodielmoense TaxID=1776385 RepID=UPI000A26D5D3|nr:endonuclease/exonuclease/phosphatase family protein [Clostridium massiliodielmoense]